MCCLLPISLNLGVVLFFFPSLIDAKVVMYSVNVIFSLGMFVNSSSSFT